MERILEEGHIRFLCVTKAHDLPRRQNGENLNILIKSNEESFCTERMPKSRFLAIKAENPLSLCMLGLEV